MSIPYELIVEEDLNRGYGPVTVTMPGGGSATGNKVGIHSVLGNVYSARDFGSLALAVAAIGSTQATLIVSSSQVVAANLTIPVNVTVWLIATGGFVISAGVTLTIQGPFTAARVPVFSGSGSADLTDALIDVVYPEWWGAVALKAATGAPADSTVALTAAINSRRNVSLDQGYYGATDLPQIATDGQVVFGQGMQHRTGADGQGGTILKRLSGTATFLTSGSYIGCGVRDLTLDGNNLGGVMLRVQTLYGEFRNIGIRNVGGTSYAMYLSNCNVSNFYNLNLDISNYGQIQTDVAGAAIYCNFYGCTLAAPSGAGHALDLHNAQNNVFYGCVIEGSIRQSNNCASNRFYGTGTETDVTATKAWVSCDATTLNPVFRDTTIITAVAASYPWFEFIGGYEIRLDGVRYRDLVSGAGNPLITLNGCSDVSIRHIGYYRNASSNIVDMTGTASSLVTLEHINAHSGTIGTIIANANALAGRSSNTGLTFLAGPDGVALTNWTGPVTRTNALNLVAITSSGDVGFVNLPTGATPSVGNGNAFQEVNTVPTTITNFTGGYNVQSIAISFTTANTTIDCSANANIKGNAGVDFVGAAGDSMTAVRINSVWYCTFNKAS